MQRRFSVLCFTILLNLSLISYSKAEEQGVSGSEKSRSEVEGTVTVRDTKGGQESMFKEVFSVPCFDPDILPDSRFTVLQREQLCREVCTKARGKDSLSEWVCYWQCHLHCKVGEGGDPRKKPRKKIKSINITIEVEPY